MWLLAGALLILFAWIGIRSQPDVLQYAFLPEVNTASENAASANSAEDEAVPSDETGASEPDPGTSVVPARKAMEKFETFLGLEAWGGEPPAMTIHGLRKNTTVSRSNGRSETDVTLKMAGPRFFELYPRAAAEGELLSARQIAGPVRAAVLDSDLAFRLFGEVSPIGEKVQIGENEYTVTGTVRPGRSVGSANAYTVWIPLTAGGDLTPDLLTVSARSGAEDGFSTIWRKEAERVFGEGTWTGLSREKVRAALPLRFIGLFFALVWMRKWIAVLKKWGGAFVADARRRQAHSYAVRLIPYYALRVLAAVLLLAATLAVFWGMAVLFAEPLRLFPEWVPENPVALSSIRSRFWSLIADNAVSLRLVTEETAVLSFYTFLMRVGVLLTLLGVLQTWRIRKRKAEKEET